jgi:undecaprenyl-diphosphatase
MTDITAGVLLGLAVSGLIRTSFSRFDNVPVTIDSTMVIAAITWGAICIAYITRHWSHAVVLFAPA